jgi:DDE superfamily endonuclease
VVGKDGKIICVQTAKGRKHDFRIFKESNVHIHPEIKAETDSGYQGIKKYHNNSAVLHKHRKKKKLTKEQKQHNHAISSSRVQIEHVIRKQKIFRIMAERYRNRRKRFGLRVSLIAGIYNYDLYNCFD